jgi:5'/3'-nucleotidase
MSEKPIILITNDDGVTSPGLRSLVSAMQPLGELVIVAPDRPQSGMGHAITIDDPIRLEAVSIFDKIEAYQCSGTPVDCVKLAVDRILHRKPDLCVSGINHGSNSSINVIYSGTMSAAMEAAIEGIPAIGFSLLNYDFHADFTAAKHYATKIAADAIEKGIPNQALLNVNVPNLSPEQIKGIKLCRQAKAKWQEEFNERTDPRGKKYYWLTGKFVNFDKGHDTDEWALEHGYVSIVPVSYDFTAYDTLNHLRSNWNHG